MATTVETQTVHQKKSVDFPPTPPETIVDGEDTKSVESISDSKKQFDVPLPPPSAAPTRVLDLDKPTPDSHVARDPRLIRLTGVHPFNCEAPLSELFKEGFLTSPELFYVRNHGPVPQVRDEDIPDWEFSVEGYVAWRLFGC
jgi:nitrate reductase (NAD(P)H)